MRHRPVVTLFVLVMAMILGPPTGAQQKPIAPTPQGAGSAKPFAQDQVQAMVRDGLADDTGAKAIEQRGVDFAPSGQLVRRFKAGLHLAL
jgi:hypothetical protein